MVQNIASRLKNHRSMLNVEMTLKNEALHGINKADMSERYERIKQYNKETIDMIMSLPDPSWQSIVLERYVNNLSCVEVGTKLHWSFDSVRRKIRLSIKWLEENYK